MQKTHCYGVFSVIKYLVLRVGYLFMLLVWSTTPIYPSPGATKSVNKPWVTIEKVTILAIASTNFYGYYS